MTRTGALLWKEWRDHRTALAVFAALVPLVSWPVQRWVFKFAEPEWTWTYLVPVCAGLAVAVVAADLFAMDLATSRMASFVALPVPVRRHFGVRTAFLATVALAFVAWTIAANAAIVGIYGKPGAVTALHGDFDPAFRYLTLCAAGIAGVLVFSALGVGGFRAVIAGLLLTGVGYAATMYAADLLVPRPQYWNPQPTRDPFTWLLTAAVLGGAAYAGFVGGRAHAAGRRRGALIATAVLVAAFATPAGAAAWKTYRSWRLFPDTPDLEIQNGGNHVSPDGRYVAVWAAMPGGASRGWVVRIDDGKLFDWPRRGEIVAGWTAEGLAWVGLTEYDPKREFIARLVRPETGETVNRVDVAGLTRVAVSGWSIGPHWAQWMRFDWQPARARSKGVAPTSKWRLWVKDGAEERTIEARSMPAAMPHVGEVLFATPDGQLAFARLSGGEPKIVSGDAADIPGWTSGSPDGRWFIVGTSKGYVVLDSTDWRQAAGPWNDAYVTWCPGNAGPATLMLMDKGEENLARLVEVATGREIVPDASLGILGGYAAVQRLPDGGFVARAGTNRLLHLDADGKFIRRLFPPEE